MCDLEGVGVDRDGRLEVVFECGVDVTDPLGTLDEVVDDVVVEVGLDEEVERD